jgi:hypothetical protein
MFWTSSCQSGRNFAAAHLLLKDGGELIFGEVWMTPYRLILKLSWNSKRPASSDFTLRTRKNSSWVILQIGQVADCLYAFDII